MDDHACDPGQVSRAPARQSLLEVDDVEQPPPRETGLLSLGEPHTHATSYGAPSLAVGVLKVLVEAQDVR